MLDVLFANLRDRLTQEIWLKDAENVFWRKPLVITARIAWVIGRDLFSGQASLRAMSLVYTTLLSIVPVLALLFAILKAFNVDDQVEVLMLEFLAPMGEQGKEITGQTITFVRQVNISVLGSVGLIFLVYTLISLIQKIEKAFNAVWQVASDRSITRQVTAYLSAGLIGPLFLFLVVGVIATTLSGFLLDTVGAFEPVRMILQEANKLVPYGVMIGAFSFLYYVVPNTRVRLTSALVGGSVAGILWVALGWGFATFVVTSARYAAIYSAFASLVLFMIWLYTAWLILLIGCSITYYFQNRAHLSPDSGLIRLTVDQTKRLTLLLVTLVHRSFKTGDTPWTSKRLASRLGIPPQAVEVIVATLHDAGFVAWAGHSPKLVPTKPAEMTKIRDLLTLVQQMDALGAARDERLGTDTSVDRLLATLEAARQSAIGERTIEDLIQEEKARR
ncbi:MAG: YihY/virulence factor BrkB family protein [Parvibaculum sp.]